MKKTLAVLGGASLLFALVLLFWLQPSEAAVGTLHFYQGEADVVRNGGAIQGESGMVLMNSDVLRVAPGGRIAIMLNDGSVIRLEEGSEIRIKELSFNANGTIRRALVSLLEGRIWSSLQSLPEGALYEVETPTLVGAVRGTGFGITYLKGVNKISVQRGSVALRLQSDEISRLLDGGLALEIRDERAREDFERPPGKFIADEWLLFNIEEDRKAGFIQGGVTTEPPPQEPAKELSPAPGTQSSPERALVRLEASIEGLSPDSTAVTYVPLPRSKINITAHWSDGSSKDVTDDVAWSVSGTANGSVSQSGIYVPREVGTDTVTAAYGGLEAGVVIQVIQSP